MAPRRLSAGKKDNSFEFGSRVIGPGRQESVEIPVAPLYNQTMIVVTPFIMNGVRPGPRLWVSGAIHGDELVGPAVIRELTQLVQPEELSGTLVLLPAVNVFGLLQQSRYLPDRRDLNRAFPGSLKGSLAARLAHLIMKELVGRCTHGIDLHTAAIHRVNLPQIRANLLDPETYRVAKAFGAPIIIHSEERDGSLRQAASRKGIPTLLYEAGEALRHQRKPVRVGVQGVLRVMAILGMRKSSLPAVRPPRESFRTRWVRAEKSGYVILDVKPGQRVRKGDRLGTIHIRIHSEFLAEMRLNLEAPISGVIIGQVTNPLVNVGDALVHIAALGGSPKEARGIEEEGHPPHELPQES